MKELNNWLEAFAKIWKERFARLDKILITLKKKKNGK
jgi:hypothetical protein